MVLTTLTESGMSLSDEVVDAILDQVRFLEFFLFGRFSFCNEGTRVCHFIW
jgi:hypothetical protein